MTNLDLLVAEVRALATDQNATRYSGKAQLKVDAPKLEIYMFQNLPRIAWHSGVPNHLCVFTDSFDTNHCAAYVYVWNEPDRLKCTLRLSNIDGAQYAPLLDISKSLNDREIAARLVDAVIDATERLKPRGTIEHVVAAGRGLFPSHIEWYGQGGL